MKTTQRGFALLEGLLIVLIMAIIGFGGYYVWNTQKNTDKTNVDTLKASQSTASTDTGLSTYHSKLGGFTVKYPSNWIISGGIPLDSKLNGTEQQIRIQEKPDTVRENNFSGDFVISDSAPGDTPYPFYPQGRIIKSFSNGISLWVDNQNETTATGSRVVTCPSFQIASNGAYGFKLKNGKWLSYGGSICSGQDGTTTLSYDEQLSSPEVATVYKMLESIQQ